MRAVAGIAGCLLPMTSNASAESMAGQASVIDADTIEVRGELIRLMDVDAPELDQTCLLHDDGREWPCGRVAAAALSGWISQYPVTCETHGTDNVGRWLARCDVYSIDVATWMAGNGWGLPNQDCRCEAVRAWAAFARSKGAGIWASDFVMPWIWRRAH